MQTHTSGLSLDAVSLWVGLLSLLLGAVVGSFCNVVILRLPKMLLENSETTPTHSPQPFDLSTPPSHCPQCSKRLQPSHLIPILSHWWLKGKCAFCGQVIPSRYWKTELLVSLWWLFCAFKFQLLNPTLSLEPLGTLFVTQGLSALLWALMGSALMCLTQIDWEHQLLPDAITQPLLWLGLLGANFGLLNLTPQEALWGAAVGYTSFWVIANGYRILCARDGMGQGDMKLLAALGAWMGPLSLIPLVLLASTCGAIVGIWRLKVKKDLSLNEPIAFGPFLIFAALTLLVLGPKVVLHFLGLGA